MGRLALNGVIIGIVLAVLIQGVLAARLTQMGATVTVNEDFQVTDGTDVVFGPDLPVATEDSSTGTTNDSNNNQVWATLIAIATVAMFVFISSFFGAYGGSQNATYIAVALSTITAIVILTSSVHYPTLNFSALLLPAAMAVCLIVSGYLVVPTMARSVGRSVPGLAASMTALANETGASGIRSGVAGVRMAMHQSLSANRLVVGLFLLIAGVVSFYTFGSYYGLGLFVISVVGIVTYFAMMGTAIGTTAGGGLSVAVLSLIVGLVAMSAAAIDPEHPLTMAKNSYYGANAGLFV